MFVIAGLGNPGKEYEGTRHNIGFDVIDRLADGGGYKQFKKAHTHSLNIANQKVLLAKPQTYMNRSGDSIGPIAQYYKVPVHQVIIVHDELDFAPGQIRLKKGGGAGGHNGLKSIMAHLGPDFLRIRIGIGKPTRSSGADFVLSPFKKSESSAIEDAVDASIRAIELILVEGIEAAMRTVHGAS